MPGLAGYAALEYLGEPRPGETVIVLAVASPVGSTAGQLARLVGARSVGIAASAAKCNYAIEGVGYADCVSHRKGDLREKLRRACPGGTDVYFDNVGGEVLAAVLGHLALGAPIVPCGMIEAYSMDTPPPGSFPAPQSLREPPSGVWSSRTTTIGLSSSSVWSAAGSAKAGSVIAKT